jgi:hypothetical protein
MVPHLNQFDSCPMLQDFPFINIDLKPGDVLYVPAFWWHLVQSLPAGDGITIAYNYFFSQPPDAIYTNFNAATSRADATERQMEGCIRGSKRSRVSTFTHPTTEVLSNKRSRKSQGLADGIAPAKRFPWSEEELEFLTQQISQLPGKWTKILNAGSGIFIPSRKPIHLYQKARDEGLIS